MDTKTLWKTNVGSHMWGMNRPDSDVDIFEAYSVPTKSILRGRARQNSHNSKIDGNDIAKHEVEKVMEMLIKGNLNFVLGVMSPIIIQDSHELQLIRSIFKQNLSKNIYHSIHGMAVHNYQKYFEKEKDVTWKKLAQVLRLLNFGNTLLLEEKVEFKAIPWETTIHIDEIRQKILDLDRAYGESNLPGAPDEELYRDWLEVIRMNDLKFR